jgi:methylated-DNA-[protein]-cysteine S-methyltransferase
MKKKLKENLYYSSFKIAGINFKVFASQKGIRRIFINRNDGNIKRANLTKLQPDDPYLFNIYAQMDEYLKGERKKFSVPLDLKGSVFQKKVWSELNKIPYGKTVSYKKIADKLGNVKLYRAVGRANGMNPACIIIPCHRVINSDGRLGGYSAGIKIKQKLLEVEGNISLELFEDNS